MAGSVLAGVALAGLAGAGSMILIVGRSGSGADAVLLRLTGVGGLSADRDDGARNGVRGACRNIV